LSNSDNPHKGAMFQKAVLEHFEKEHPQHFEMEKQMKY
jgi:hypothetical protein